MYYFLKRTKLKYHIILLNSVVASTKPVLIFKVKMELENGIESLSLTNSENKGPKFLNLKTSDDEIFKVDWETLFQSATIRNM